MTEASPCPLCGALPVDWVDDPHKAETGLCWVIAEIRQILGVNEKPMLGDLPGILRARLYHADPYPEPPLPDAQLANGGACS